MELLSASAYENLYRDVNDGLQKAIIVLRGNILTLFPNDKHWLPPNKTKSTTRGMIYMHYKRSDFLTELSL